MNGITDGGIFDDPEPVEIDGDEVTDSPQSNLPMTHAGKVHIICVADQNGQPMIARAVADKSGQLQPIEQYRRPTQEEFNKIQSRGQIVKQGQPQATGETPQNTQTGSTELPVGKIALAAGVVGATGLGIWYWWKKSKSSDRISNGDDNDSGDDGYDDDNDDDEN